MAIGLKHRLDYSDLADLPADGKRYEILDGRIHVTPAPSPAHQRVCLGLARQLQDHFETRGLGLVFVAPLDVILAEHDIVEPDVVVAAEPAQVSQRGVEGAPVLVVEVLSPSTERTDRGTKSQRYAARGVEHFWVVDPEIRRVECYRLVDGAYAPIARAEGVGTLAIQDFPGLTIDLAPLWL